jgi:hypothetical protein
MWMLIHYATGLRDGTKPIQNGRHENANEQREDLSGCRTAPLEIAIPEPTLAVVSRLFDAGNNSARSS